LELAYLSGLPDKTKKAALIPAINTLFTALKKERDEGYSDVLTPIKREQRRFLALFTLGYFLLFIISQGRNLVNAIKAN
jgi:hypothetical protein